MAGSILKQERMLLLAIPAAIVAYLAEHAIFEAGKTATIIVMRMSRKCPDEGEESTLEPSTPTGTHLTPFRCATISHACPRRCSSSELVASRFRPS